MTTTKTTTIALDLSEADAFALMNALRVALDKYSEGIAQARIGSESLAFNERHGIATLHVLNKVGQAVREAGNLGY